MKNAGARGIVPLNEALFFAIRPLLSKVLCRMQGTCPELLKRFSDEPRLCLTTKYRQQSSKWLFQAREAKSTITNQK